MLIGQTVSHYRIVEKLGEGGMGSVYLAEDTRLGRLVALKFLPSELTSNERARERFVSEARAASSLKHPSICTIHDIDQTDDGLSFISMSYCEGTSLADRLAEGPLDVADAVETASQIADGLAAAHEQGVVHRDIKPANVMSDSRGRAKIVDFGLALLTEGRDETIAGAYAGTSAYMSPEQARGGVVDERTDIWSLGATLYEMVTGRRPFDSEYREAEIYSILNEPVRPPSQIRPDLPDAVERVIMTCLEKDRDSRYASAAELVDALKEATPARIEARARFRKRKLTRRARLARAAAAPAVAAVALAVAAWTHPATRLAVLRWLGAPPIPEVRKVVVLPFSSGGDGESDAVAEGVSAYISERLSDTESVECVGWVASHRDVRENAVADIEEARSVLGANLVLTGAVERDSADVRVAVDLWDVPTGGRLGSTVVAEPIGNVSALQNVLPNRVAELLGLDGGCEPPRGCGTTVPAAFESYVAALGHYYRTFDERERALGIASFDSLNMAAADSLLSLAVESDPGYALAWAALARVRADDSRSLSSYESACDCCGKAIALGDLIPEAHVTRGDMLARSGQNEGAIEEYRRALSIDPVCAAAIRGLAASYTDLGDVSRAELTYRRAVQLRPGLWSAHNDLGILLLSIGRYGDAATEFERATLLAPCNVQTLRNLGVAYYCLERWEDSREMFERSLAVRPTYAVYSNLATLHFQLGRYADAARTYRLALDMDDSDYRVWGNLAASCLWVPGERDRASEFYTVAAEKAEDERGANPDDPTLLCLLAGYYGALGDSSRAVPLLDEALALAHEDVEVMFQAGHTYERLGDRENALLWIGRAIDHGYSIAQVTATPGLRGLCSDERFQELVGHETVSF